MVAFHERRLPQGAKPAGYAALIGAFNLKVPLPHRLTAVGDRHRRQEQDGWCILPPRLDPEPSLEGHLTFALKHEGLDLAVLKRLFAAVGPTPIVGLVKASPTGTYSRRIWFLYEWLTGTKLDLPNADRGSYPEIVDPKQQFAVTGKSSSRHRVKNNLPGTPAFCPLVFKTKTLDGFIAKDLSARARELIASVPRDLADRTAAILLVKDSKSSFDIEGESPPQGRIQRWARTLGQAGRATIDTDELVRLQAIVIGDSRFVKMGLRQEGGFVGINDHQSQLPIPDHFSARPEDLVALMEGLASFDREYALMLDPVLAAAVLAFGFVYIHPFADGNGRLHRYLIQHVLARHGFNPPGTAFPVSSAILTQIADYRSALEAYSLRLLPLIQWEFTSGFNVRVLNDTGDYYRFFDATPQTEFLYDCVQRTVETEVPLEVSFLRRYYRFRMNLNLIVDMPERSADLLFRFVHQNGGRLSLRGRKREIAALTDDEVERVEAIYRDAFTGEF